jgi:hypothetical protein
MNVVQIFPDIGFKRAMPPGERNIIHRTSSIQQRKVFTARTVSTATPYFGALP